MSQAQLSFQLEPPPAPPAAASVRALSLLPPPKLIIHWTPFWPAFTQNVADFAARRDGSFVPSHTRPGEFWPDVFVQRPMPWKELAQSGILHLLLATFIALTSTMWLGRKEVSLDSPLSHSAITYYKTEAFMPEVKTAAAKSPSRAQSKHDPVKAAQEIISVPNDADNSEQTLSHLPHPEILRGTEPLPSLIVEVTPKVAARAP